MPVVSASISFIVTVAWVSVAVAATPQAHAYERQVKALPLGSLEKRLLGVVKNWARGRHMPMKVDSRLSRAASHLLESVPHSAGERIDINAAKRYARRGGWTDGDLVAVAMRVPQAEGVSRAFAAQLRLRLSDISLNRVGLAAQRHNGTIVVLAFLSHRLVHLKPVASEVHGNYQIRIAGHLDQSIDHGTLTLVWAGKDSRPSRVRLPMIHRLFEKSIWLQAKPGVVHVQVLLHRGRGPEVAASFPVGVDVSPWQAQGQMLDVADAFLDQGTSSRHLGQLILDVRSSHGLSLPTRSAMLDDVARAHAEDMRDHGFFAHISPTTGDVAARLLMQHIAFGRVFENIAQANDPASVVASWLESPSHRANLLNASIATFGIGMAPKADGSLFAVIILVRPPVSITKARSP